jgi:periplasmic protein TonB
MTDGAGQNSTRAGSTDVTLPPPARGATRVLATCLLASALLHAGVLVLVPAFRLDGAPAATDVLDVIVLAPRSVPDAEADPQAASPQAPEPVAVAPRTKELPRALESKQAAKPERPLAARQAEPPAHAEPRRGPPEQDERPVVARSEAPREPAVPAPRGVESEPQAPPVGAHGERLSEETPAVRPDAVQAASEVEKPSLSAPVTAPAARAVTPPRFNAAYLRNPAPRYPIAARRAGEQGTVMLKVLVSREGRSALVDIETSSGSARLDSAAREAVKSWRFVPARRGAEPVESWVLVPVVFRLEGTS